MELEKITGPRSRRYDDACGTALALEFIGERWSLLIMRELMFGPRRFGEIRANLPGISANVLTQRLEALEEAGILLRRKLPSPANVQVYELTRWGTEARPMIRDLGRWAARSPRHDPMLFMSPASAMISLETLIDPARAADVDLTIAFAFGDDRYVARVTDGVITIARGESDVVDAAFAGDTMALRMTIYGKLALDDPRGMAISGGLDAAHRFIDLFALPTKWTDE